MAGIEQVLDNISNVADQLPVSAREKLAFDGLTGLKGDSNSVWYAMQTARWFCNMVLDQRADVRGMHVMELGGGSQMLSMGLFWLLYGASSYVGMDKFCDVDADPELIERTRRVMGLVYPPGTDVDVDAIARFKSGRLVTDEQVLRVARESFEEADVAESSVDLLYSLAVMEHVDDVRGKVRRMHRALAPGGLAIHTIDLREHYTPERQGFDKNVSLDFLKYSGQEWEAKFPPGTEYYINRLRASEHRAIFEQEGFDVLECRTTQSLTLDASVYDSVHPEFHRFSLEDLSTLGVVLIARRSS